jgi:hypothetical protein
MQQSIYKTIKNKILKYPRGKIIFPINFRKIGNEESVKKALFRLERNGFLIRLAHGIYLYPQQDKELGILYPSVESIAKAIAKRDKARILPTGIQALNMLGLSTQIPLNVIYLTDASPRTINLGSRKITFKKASHKGFQAKGKISRLVIQALKSMGKRNVTSEDIEKIRQILRKEQVKNIIHDSKLAPVWISNILLNKQH